MFSKNRILRQLMQGRGGKLMMGSGQPFMVWVWIWKISPKNVKIFNFFPFGSKKISLCRVKKVPGSKAGRPLFHCGLKVSSGRVRSANWANTEEEKPGFFPIHLLANILSYGCWRCPTGGGGGGKPPNSIGCALQVETVWAFKNMNGNFASI